MTKQNYKPSLKADFDKEESRTGKRYVAAAAAVFLVLAASLCSRKDESPSAAKFVFPSEKVKQKEVSARAGERPLVQRGAGAWGVVQHSGAVTEVSVPRKAMLVLSMHAAAALGNWEEEKKYKAFAEEVVRNPPINPETGEPYTRANVRRIVYRVGEKWMAVFVQPGTVPCAPSPEKYDSIEQMSEADVEEVISDEDRCALYQKNFNEPFESDETFEERDSGDVDSRPKDNPRTKKETMVQPGVEAGASEETETEKGEKEPGDLSLAPSSSAFSISSRPSFFAALSDRFSGGGYGRGARGGLRRLVT